MSQSRTNNAKRNIFSGLTNKFITLIFPFAVRTVIIRVLGAEYLGLGSLFTSLLQIISLAELGFSSAIVFSLYKPLAFKDKKTICALLSFYRQMYRIVGFIIFALGIIFMPLLHIIIHDDIPDNINIYILYFIYLFNTVISYFAFAYKSSLITADQRQDILNNLSSILNVFFYVIQILALIAFSNYYMYVCISVIHTLANNVIINIITNIKYPEYHCEGIIDKEEKDKITTQIKGLAIGKFSKAARNSFDAIVLSAFLGLTEVAIYSNYYYVFNAVWGFIIVLLNSISAGVGNSIAIESREKNFQDFKKFHFYILWISSWCSICMICLYQPFMKLWAGKGLVASNTVALLFCIYFYITQLGQVRSLYSSGAGLWWEFRWIDIGEMISNLLLNFLLGYYWGMIGILIATIITVYFFSIIGNTQLTFKLYFNKPSRLYHCANAVYTFICIIVGAATYYLCGLFSNNNVLIVLLVRAFICLIIPNLAFLFLSILRKEYRNYISELFRRFHGAD